MTSTNTYVTYNDYYYYNPSNGFLISAFPNGNSANSVTDLVAMVKKFCPGVAGFMNWEAESEFAQSTKKMTTLQNAINA
jgi:hypothetical protein